MGHWIISIGKISLAAVFAAGLTSGVPLDTSDTAYDAIVCGAGVSGNVVAARLAASGAKTLLLERGPASTAKSGGTVFMPWNDTVTVFDVPAFASNLGSLNSSWRCSDTAGGAGCVFGGSGSLNALAWIPPSRWDFDDRWPEGWKFDDIHDAYKSVESFNPGSIHASSDGVFYEGTPLHYVAGMLQAENWTQVDAIKNPNEKYQVYGQPPQNVIQGQGIRSGPANVLFSEALSNPNFSWRLNSYVVRVVRSGGQATGVEVQNNDGSRYIVNVNPGGKIILTAGALSTPRILFNSGIGPKSQIQIVQSGTTNVTLPPENEWIDLPVGHNLRDHPIVHLAIETENGQNFTYWSSSSLWNGGWNTTEVDMYNTRAAGPIAQAPQRAMLWTHALGNDNLTRYMQSTFEETGPGQLTILAYQTHGQTSTGVVGIQPNGTTVLLQEPWFNTEGDITASTAWLDRFRSYLDSSPNLKLSAAYEGLDSRYIVTNNYSSGVHWGGTAMLGAENDGNSVVDLNVKVWGMQNLFVADTSFHADVPTGNMQAQAAIAAEAAVAKIIAVQI